MTNCRRKGLSGQMEEEDTNHKHLLSHKGEGASRGVDFNDGFNGQWEEEGTNYKQLQNHEMQVRGAMEVGWNGGWEEENNCKWQLIHKREVAKGEMGVKGGMEVNEEWSTNRQQYSLRWQEQEDRQGEKFLEEGEKPLGDQCQRGQSQQEALFQIMRCY